MNKINNEEAPQYITVPSFVKENKIIAEALKILTLRIKKPKAIIENPNDVKKFLKLKLTGLEHEVFAVMFLNNHHGVIEYEEMFRGTIDGASVYPREVVKRALQLNAAALILAHNHPSGNPESSMEDERITTRLVKACSLVDIRIIDHVIVGSHELVSFAERGLI